AADPDADADARTMMVAAVSPVTAPASTPPASTSADQATVRAALPVTPDDAQAETVTLTRDDVIGSNILAQYQNQKQQPASVLAATEPVMQMPQQFGGQPGAQVLGPH